MYFIFFSGAARERRRSLKRDRLRPAPLSVPRALASGSFNRALFAVGQTFVCLLSIFFTGRLKSVQLIFSSPHGAEPKRREPLIPTRAVGISGITPVAEVAVQVAQARKRNFR